MVLTEVLEFIYSYSSAECHTNNGLVASTSMSWCQPIKLQHAIYIADRGEVETAWKYVQCLRRTVDAHKRAMGTNNKPAPVNYSPTFQHRLTLFEDRLANFMGQDAQKLRNMNNNNNSSSSSSSSGSIGGGFLSKVSSSILVGLEKMTQAEDEDEAEQTPPLSTKPHPAFANNNNNSNNLVNRPASINTRSQSMGGGRSRVVEKAHSNPTFASAPMQQQHQSTVPEPSNPPPADTSN
jgi:hypothetical protein